MRGERKRAIARERVREDGGKKRASERDRAREGGKETETKRERTPYLSVANSRVNRCP